MVCDGDRRNLNNSQQEAVKHLEGRVAINSGAGTGKSSVLVARMREIRQHYPEAKILMISFTKKAAQELKSRIGSVNNVQISTFHSLAYKLLMVNGYIGKLITGQLTEAAIIKKLIGKADTTTEDVIISLSAPSKADEKTVKIRNIYLAYLKKHKLLSFNTMQIFALELLNDHGIRKRWQSLWQFILVDEYQDVDENQLQLLNVLAEHNENICCTGDSRQAIYSFRGNVPTAQADFSATANCYDLTVNYRSTPAILELANRIMYEYNPLVAAAINANDFYYPEYLTADDEEKEASAVISKICSLHKAGIPYSKMAILYRSSFAAEKLIETMLEQNIPFSHSGSCTLSYEQRPYSDILNMLRLSLMPNDELCVKSVLKSLYLRSNVIKEAKAIAKKNNCNLHRALLKLKLPFFQQEYLEGIISALEKMPKQTPSDAIKSLLKAEYNKYLGEQGCIEATAFMEEIKEYESIIALLNHVDEALYRFKQQQSSAPNDSVKIMSIHSAKGMEWDNVFIIGCYDGCLPSANDGTDMEEERRLLYVAVTRAKKRLYISYPQKSNKSQNKNEPCCFLHKALSFML